MIEFLKTKSHLVNSNVNIALYCKYVEFERDTHAIEETGQNWSSMELQTWRTGGMYKSTSIKIQTKKKNNYMI